MRILLVEDDKKVANFIKRGLREERYSVDVAYDGEDGFFLAQSEDYDLIILDIMLPKKDGLEILRDVRQTNRSVPILLLTAKDSVSDKVLGLDAGGDDYLTKPFAFAELLARIRALLRRGKFDSPVKLRVGDLVMDLPSHQVRRGSREIELTPKEYALLEYFMRNAGHVVTRTMIAEHVWDYNFDSFTNVIDVYVNYLRNKIDKGFDKKLIQTVRGVGYVIKE